MLQTTDLVSVLPKAKSNIATCLKLHSKMPRTSLSLRPSGLEQCQGEHPDLGLRATSALLALQACNVPAGKCGMECVEAALFFERNEAMALHYQSTVRRWKRAPDGIPASWTLRPQDAQEFHSCLTDTRKIPESVAGLWTAKIWSRFRRHCRNFRSHNSHHRFDEEKFKKHKRLLFDWPCRREAYRALYGDTPRPLHIEMMDTVAQWISETNDYHTRWLFSDTMFEHKSLRNLVDMLEEAYWGANVSKVKAVESVILQAWIDTENEDFRGKLSNLLLRMKQLGEERAEAVTPVENKHTFTTY